ncbi:MAG: 3-oxoacyl-ACP synthase, partial [Paracoccaceae bacterium]
MGVIRAVIKGCGHYLPERVVENDEFTETLDTSDEWIRARTGIERRHFAADDQKTSDLAYEAAIVALKNAGMTGNNLDTIILA